MDLSLEEGEGARFTVSDSQQSTDPFNHNPVPPKSRRTGHIVWDDAPQATGDSVTDDTAAVQTQHDARKTTDEDKGILISRALRAAMGDECPPGACQDCGGITVVPDLETGQWQVCPTCRGVGQGGYA